MRGNRSTPAPAAGRAGSIPACAGEPGFSPRLSSAARVYPRVCGGTNLDSSCNQPGQGLSPRVRGNRLASHPILRGRRSIPACAGEPPDDSKRGQSGGVYPRVCGGTPTPGRPEDTRWGLSPRVRGNRRATWTKTARKRSIPACAGEPGRARVSRHTSEVYPRVCGGTPRSAEPASRRRGLSPRVRGNHMDPRLLKERERSIPACAGEPRVGRDDDPDGGVYPRVCGGTSRPGRPWPCGRGLSPRVRGNQPPRASLALRAGSIPACAGEPGGSAGAAVGEWVYPRVCGGTWHWGFLLVGHGGLSPRVRGNPEDLTGEQGSEGSIPACAGEPQLGRARAE